MTDRDESFKREVEAFNRKQIGPLFDALPKMPQAWFTRSADGLLLVDDGGYLRPATNVEAALLAREQELTNALREARTTLNEAPTDMLNVERYRIWHECWALPTIASIDAALAPAVEEQQTLPCGHPESDLTSADSYTFCAVCAAAPAVEEQR